MKRILGLDLGSTSIGWAIINENSKEITNADSKVQNQDEIVAIGSRIIPLNPDPQSLQRILSCRRYYGAISSLCR